MTLIQERILKIGLVFKTICEKYNLKYFIIGGTLLGAVRHNGFIPWDDDMDFAMPKEDYDKFIQIAKKELHGTIYALRDFSTDGLKYQYLSARIDDTTTLVNFDQYPETYYYKGGLFIDIFPLVDTFNSKRLRNLHCKIIMFLLLLQWYALHKDPQKTSSLTKSILLSLNKWLFQREISIYFLKKVLYLANNKKSDYIFGISYGEKEMFPKAFFQTDIHDKRMLTFEGYLFNAPFKSEKILENIYGNYMKIPDKKEREQGKHYFDVKFDTPYQK